MFSNRFNKIPNSIPENNNAQPNTKILMPIIPTPKTLEELKAELVHISNGMRYGQYLQSEYDAVKAQIDKLQPTIIPTPKTLKELRAELAQISKGIAYGHYSQSEYDAVKAEIKQIESTLLTGVTAEEWM